MYDRYETSEVRIAWLFISPLVLIVGFFILVPIIGTFWNSLFIDVSFLPRRFIGIQNYLKLLSSEDFQNALSFTLTYTVVAVSLEIFLGTAFALLLNEEFFGRGILRAAILIPWAIPTIVSAKTWQLIYEYSYGLMNHLILLSGFYPERINWFGSSFSAFCALIVADVWKTTPFVVLILLAGLQAIPEDLYKQARVDGAGIWKRFRRITLPLLSPVMAIALIFRTNDSIRMFNLVYVLTGGGPGGSTKTLSFLGFESFANDSFGMGSAVSVITFVVAFSICLLHVKKVKFSDR